MRTEYHSAHGKLELPKPEHVHTARNTRTGYRIGSLSEEEAKEASTSFEFGDAYETDPVRDPNLLP